LNIQKSALNFAAGLTKNFAKLGILLCSLSLINASFAHTPKPGQIAQHQARRLSTNRTPFKQSGTVVVDGKTYKTELRWFAPSSYDLVISGLPSSFTGMAGAEGQWTLQRRAGNRCSLVAGNRFVQCGPAMFWAMIELSAQPDAVSGALIRAGIYGSQDAVFDETHSASVSDARNRRVQLAVGKNGDTAKAVMRIRAPGAASEAVDAAYIDFDQNFLVPLYAQFNHQGALYKIKAHTELGIDREQPRYSHVLASSLRVMRGEENTARFTRAELTTDRALKEEKFREGVVTLNSFQESLSGDASNLLTALLLTH
jgi:hypothetical protein